MLLHEIKGKFIDIMNILADSLRKEGVEGFFNGPDCIKEHLKISALDIREFSDESIVYCKHKDWKQAIESLEWLIFLEPVNPSHFLRLGAVFLQIGNYGEALEILVQGSNLDSDNPEFFLYIGSCYLGLGEKDRAKESFKTALELSKGNSAYKEILLLAREGVHI